MVAERVVSEARSVGTPEYPRAAIPAHTLRALRRELGGKPEPTAFATMSAS